MPQLKDFHVGDKVRVKTDSYNFTSVVNCIHDGHLYLTKSEHSDKERSGLDCDEHKGNWKCIEHISLGVVMSGASGGEPLEIINKSLTPTLMFNLIPSFKALFRTEPQKSYIELGITDNQGVLTQEGRELYQQYTFEQSCLTTDSDFYKNIVKPLMDKKNEEKK